MEAHVWFVAGLCAVTLVLLLAIGIHQRTVELPRRALARKKDVLNKYA